MKKFISFKLTFIFIILVTELSCNMLPRAKTLVPDTSSSESTITKEITPPPSKVTIPLPSPSPLSSSFVASPTEISSPMTVSPYDDFEDEKFNGTFDTSLFSISFDSEPHCIISQEDRVLRIQKRSEVNDFLDCSLSIERPISVKSTRLENMSSSMLLKSDHQGNLVQTTLTVDARFDDINTNG